MPSSEGLTNAVSILGKCRAEGGGKRLQFCAAEVQGLVSSELYCCSCWPSGLCKTSGNILCGCNLLGRLLWAQHQIEGQAGYGLLAVCPSRS